MSDPKYYHSALRDKRESGRVRLRVSSSLTDKGENGSKDAGIRASTSGGSRVDEGMRSLFSFFPFFFFSTWHRPVFNFEQGASVFQGVEQWLEMPGRPVGLAGACSNQCSLWWVCVSECVCGGKGGVYFFSAINALCRWMLIKCGIWALILPGRTKRECFTR